jgi:hypothetical protein
MIRASGDIPIMALWHYFRNHKPFVPVRFSMESISLLNFLRLVRCPDELSLLILTKPTYPGQLEHALSHIQPNRFPLVDRTTEALEVSCITYPHSAHWLRARLHVQVAHTRISTTTVP